MTCRHQCLFKFSCDVVRCSPIKKGQDIQLKHWRIYDVHCRVFPAKALYDPGNGWFHRKPFQGAEYHWCASASAKCQCNTWQLNHCWCWRHTTPLRNGKLVRLTGFKVLQSHLVFHQHLQPQHLWHRWRIVYWEKSEVMRLNRYCVMLKVMFLILSAGGGSMNKRIPYCLLVRVDYSLFQHRLRNANDISVLLMPGTSSHLSGTWCFLKLSRHCL